MSLYRFAVFGVKSLSEYTRSGFESASKRFNADDLNVDMSDQYIMITAANSGIGKETALECAKRHAHVYMVCRNGKSGKEVPEEIIRESNNSNIELYLCDLSKPQDVLEFTKNFLQIRNH